MRLKRATIATTTLAITLATTGVAHEGVENPAVKARMQVMSDIGDAVGVLGGMARGKTAFDATAAEAAKAALSEAASQVTVTFEAKESDPKSEAAPAIWDNWDDFAAKAQVLIDGTAGLDASSLEGIQASMRTIGGSCSACHRAYRIKN